jgi:hypothetical protein
MSKLIPLARTEVLVWAAETINQVVLEGADGTFGSIATVDIRRD